MFATDFPFGQCFDLDGRPLTAGKVYYGVAGMNPITNPISVYWDADGTQPASLPISTLNGYPVRSGTPTLVFANVAYSMLVLNKKGQTVFYLEDSSDLPSSIAARLGDHTSGTYGPGMIGYGPALKYPANSIGALMGKKVLVNLYGADTTASAATNDAAFASALAVLSASGFGGQVIYGRGQYQHSTTLVVDIDDVEVVGAGNAANHNTLLPSGAEGGTQLVFGNTSGAGVHLKGVGCGLRDIVITGDATRYAQAWSVSKPGVLVEAEDAVGAASWRTKIHNVHVMWQPGDGIQFIGDIVNSSLVSSDVDNVKGYGVVIDGGTYRTRTNVARPGQIDLWSVRISRTGGCAIRAGDPATDATERAYRIGLHNVECFYNRTDATFPAYAWYIGGENIESSMCAVGGEKSAGVGDHSGVYCWGRTHRHSNIRFVDCEPYCVYVDDPAAATITTTDIDFDIGYINNDNQAAGYYDPAVFIVAGCLNIGAKYHGRSGDVTALMSVDAGYHAREEGSFKVFQGTTVSNFRTNELELSIDDDQAYYLDFTANARGILVISGNVEAAGALVMHFRCGDGSAAINILSSSSGVTITDGGTGVLTGTTGADGALTVRVDNTLDRVYIENRLGALRVYNVAVLACSAELESVGVSS